MVYAPIQLGASRAIASTRDTLVTCAKQVISAIYVPLFYVVDQHPCSTESFIRYFFITAICPDNEYNNHCYYFATEELDFSGAQAACQGMGKELVAIETSGEQEWLEVKLAGK